MNRKQRRILFRLWARAKRRTWLELPPLCKGQRLHGAAILIASTPDPERSGDLDHRDRDRDRDDRQPRRQPGPRFHAA